MTIITLGGTRNSVVLGVTEVYNKKTPVLSLYEVTNGWHQTAFIRERKFKGRIAELLMTMCHPTPQCLAT